MVFWLLTYRANFSHPLGLLSTFYFLLSTFYFLLSTFYFLLSTFYFLLSTFYLLSRLFWLLSRSDFIRYGSGVSSESQVLPMRPCHLPEIK
jgi:hypothetical protein